MSASDETLKNMVQCVNVDSEKQNTSAIIIRCISFIAGLVQDRNNSIANA